MNGYHQRKLLEEIGNMEDAVTLCLVLARNVEIFRARLGAPSIADVLIRRF